jgi:hypothetical protein
VRVPEALDPSHDEESQSNPTEIEPNFYSSLQVYRYGKRRNFKEEPQAAEDAGSMNRKLVCDFLRGRGSLQADWRNMSTG